MNCKHIRKNIFAYRENSLKENQRLSFEKHLQQCIDCASFVGFSNNLWNSTSLHEKLAADDFFYTRLSAKLTSKKQAKFSLLNLLPSRVKLKVIYIAVLLIAILLGINIGSFDKNIFLKNNFSESIVSATEENDYLKTTTADQVYDNQYLKLIENGNNQETSNH